MSRLFWIIPGIMLVASCSAPSPFGGESYDTLRQKPPLPFSVRVNHIRFIHERGGSQAQSAQPAPAAYAPGDAARGRQQIVTVGAEPPKIGRTAQEVEIRKSVVEALEKYHVFHKLTDSGDADLDLTITVKAPALTGVGRVERTDVAWLNLGLWLLAGVPAWFVSDLVIDQRVEMSFELNRTAGPEERAFMRNSIDLADINKLNFVRRAGIWQYALQIIVPPFLVPPKQDVADASLYENYRSKLQSDVAETIKRDLYRSLISTGLPVLLDLSSDASKFRVLLCTQRPEVSILIERPGVTTPLVPQIERRETLRDDEVARVREILGSNEGLLREANYINRWVVEGELRDIDEGDVVRIIVRYQDRKGQDQTWSQTIRMTSGNTT